MPLLVRRLLWSPFIAFFAATLLIAGCSGGSNSGVSGGDLDKDGIVDQHDLDIDGDGIPNESDPTPGGNGVTPPNPKVACAAAKIIVPNDELRAGTLTTLKWELLPEGCGVSSDTPLATAYAHVVNRGGLEDTKSKPVSPGATGAKTKIPAACGGEGEKIAVTYDILEVGVALGDTKLSKGAYTQTVNHPVPPCGSTGAGFPDIEDIPMCPDDVTPINDAKDNCTCPEGEEYDGATNSCEVVVVACTHLKWGFETKNRYFDQSASVTWQFEPAGCVLPDPDQEFNFYVGNTNSNYVDKPKSDLVTARLSDKKATIPPIGCTPDKRGAKTTADPSSGWALKFNVSGLDLTQQSYANHTWLWHYSYNTNQYSCNKS